jgi:hypothetical protein
MGGLRISSRRATVARLLQRGRHKNAALRNHNRDLGIVGDSICCSGDQDAVSAARRSVGRRLCTGGPAAPAATDRLYGRKETHTEQHAQ